MSHSNVDYQNIRKECALTKVQDLEPLHTFASFPVFMGCTTNEIAEDQFADMSWMISKSSGLIQLAGLLPLDVLYPMSHGAGEVGDLWKSHHAHFAKFLYRHKPTSVFEIGGAHGILETEYQKFARIPWTILEPNPHPVTETKAKYIEGFFDHEFQYKEFFDTVVHSHVFEHIYEPLTFMQALRQFMPEGSKLIFSVPNMKEMMQRKYTNCLNFEHTIFLTEEYIEYLLAVGGFKVDDKEFFKSDHSIFYAATKQRAITERILPNNLYDLNRNLYLEFIDYHEKLICNINSQIKKTSWPVYLFGAHVFSQYLISFGLDTSQIIGIIDNDSAKQGKRLYGSKLKVFSPKVLDKVKNPVIILRAGVYNEEIRSDIINNYNSNAQFIE